MKMRLYKLNEHKYTLSHSLTHAHTHMKTHATYTAHIHKTQTHSTYTLHIHILQSQYTRTHTHVHTSHTQEHKHTIHYTYTITQTHIHTQHTYTYIHTPPHIHEHIHKYTFTHAQTHVHTYIHTCSYTYNTHRLMHKHLARSHVLGSCRTPNPTACLTHWPERPGQVLHTFVVTCFRRCTLRSLTEHVGEHVSITLSPILTPLPYRITALIRRTPLPSLYNCEFTDVAVSARRRRSAWGRECGCGCPRGGLKSHPSWFLLSSFLLSRLGSTTDEVDVLGGDTL